MAGTAGGRRLAYGAMAILALAPRCWLLDFESGDYRGYLSPWYDYFVEHGRWKSLGDDFSNYYVPYLVLLSFSTLLPLPKLYAIKLISILFDYVAAWLVGRLVWHRYQNQFLSLAGFTAVLFWPTVLMNSALWGQCDIIYTSALLVVFLSVLQRRPWMALAAFGLAVSFKPQAVFFLPFLAGLFLCGLLPWRLLWVPLAVYAACGLPAILAGKSVLAVLGHWLWQENLPHLTAGAVNVYQWLPAEPRTPLAWLGIGLAAIASGGLIVVLKRNWETEDRDQRLAAAALLSVLLLPFFMPGMHERYFFPADLFALVYAFFVPRRWFLAMWVVTASALSYLPFLFGVEPVPRSMLSAVMAAALGVVARDLVLAVAHPVFAPVRHGL
ncbi:conjugal transfer protein TraL [Fontisphaera persica]|uniref:glycosyltransferase 87 family protein n=1 Tax=Fontisphaera persica TaxID=2974023 RepID=UPI0024C0A6A6|nr:glycosyltransferase 87 family protein [Fontisphaera persica]WCJ60616.1 conjugal transfer protein TraL [Fontisphaera persica]